MPFKSKVTFWDSNEQLGPQPPCAGAELDNETGAMPYESDEREEAKQEEHERDQNQRN